jgi:hypothetical protein
MEKKFTAPTTAFQKPERGKAMGVERTFQDIPEGKLEEADQQVFLVSIGWSRGSGWQDLLSSKRVFIISEAGAGKTHECRTQCQRLSCAGSQRIGPPPTGRSVAGRIHPLQAKKSAARAG